MALFKKHRRTQKPCVHRRHVNPTNKEIQESSSLSELSKPSAPQEDISKNNSQGIFREKSVGQVWDATPSPHKIEKNSLPCDVCKAEKLAARKYRWKLIAGLFLPFSVQALDATIIASALPFMASDFRKLSTSLAVLSYRILKAM